MYGVGAEVSSRIYEEVFDYVDAPIKRVAQKEVPAALQPGARANGAAAHRRCHFSREGGVVMADTVTMPKLGFDMARRHPGALGERRRAMKSSGDVLAEIETDKATVEVESSFRAWLPVTWLARVISFRLVTPIAIIAAPGESVEDAAQASRRQPNRQEEGARAAGVKTARPPRWVGSRPPLKRQGRREVPGSPAN
jgi:hypothetical protein